MIREEAKSISITNESIASHNGKMVLNYNPKYKDSLIDEIYDYFESRTCESCKYWMDDISGVRMCNISDGIACKESTLATDGCNKWESK